MLSSVKKKANYVRKVDVVEAVTQVFTYKQANEHWNHYHDFNRTFNLKE